MKTAAKFTVVIAVLIGLIAVVVFAAWRSGQGPGPVGGLGTHPLALAMVLLTIACVLAAVVGAIVWAFAAAPTSRPRETSGSSDRPEPRP